MGKGEIARYEQFLLCPTVYSKDLTRNNKGLLKLRITWYNVKKKTLHKVKEYKASKQLFNIHNASRFQSIIDSRSSSPLLISPDKTFIVVPSLFCLSAEKHTYTPCTSPHDNPYLRQHAQCTCRIGLPQSGKTMYMCPSPQICT